MPMAIDPAVASGSRVRPLGMLAGFKEIGLEVDIIWGYAAQRKQAIEAVKQEIEAGAKYDFLYSESSTMPTILTEQHHFPTHPFLDFEFFRFCKRFGIPIGLYYRDVHWRFEQYRRRVSWYKRLITLPCYHLDLLAYRHWVDALFLAHLRMFEHFSFWPQGRPVYDLPPGGKIMELGFAPVPGCLRLLYVGGVQPPLHDISNLLEGVFWAAQGGLGVYLTVCCPGDQWESRPESYKRWAGDHLRVVHLSGESLQALYQQHDIAAIYLVPSSYFDFAMPVKVFEAIGYGRPLIATQDTAVADFIEQERCGWTVSADPRALEGALRRIMAHPKEVEEKTHITEQIRHRHTWASRADRAAKILQAIGETTRQTRGL